MTLEISGEDNRFRLIWQGYSIGWLPDTPSNRKAILVFLRLLCDGNGKRVFKFRELSGLFGGNNRQAANGHVERFRQCGSDFLRFLLRWIGVMLKRLCKIPRVITTNGLPGVMLQQR